MQLITVLVIQLHCNMQYIGYFCIKQCYFNTNTVMSYPTKYVNKNYNVVL